MTRRPPSDWPPRNGCSIMLGGLAGTPPRITPLGDEMLALPVHPRLARLLVAARQDGRIRDGAAVAALLSERDIRARQRQWPPAADPARQSAASGLSDILDRLDMLAEAEAMRFAPSLRSRGIDPAAARQVALLRDELLRTRSTSPDEARCERRRPGRRGGAQMAAPGVSRSRGQAPRGGTDRRHGRRAGRAPRSRNPSCATPSCIWHSTPAKTAARGPREAQVRLASTIELEWLEELFPANVRRERLTRYDESRRRVIGANQLWYHDLLLREDPSATVDPSRSRARSGRGPPAPSGRPDPRPAPGRPLARSIGFRQAGLARIGLDRFRRRGARAGRAPICQGRTSLDEVEQADFVPFLQSRLAPGLIRELDAECARDASRSPADARSD